MRASELRRRAGRWLGRAALSSGLLAAAAAGAKAAPHDPAELDSLVTAGRAAEAESLATRALAVLEAEPRPDSARLAGLRASFARARLQRPRSRDEKGIPAALAAAAWYARTPAGALESLRLRALAGRMLYEVGFDDSSAVTLQAVLDEATRRTDVPATMMGDLHTALGRALLVPRGRRAGMAHLWRAHELAARSLGPEHPDVARLLGEIGSDYATAAVYDSARILLERARSIFEREPATHAKALGEVLGSLATLERMQGRLAESVERIQQAIDVARRAEGDSSLNVARLRANLALRTALLQDFHGARRHLDQAIPVLEAQLGPETGLTLNNRILAATVLGDLGDTTSAWRELQAVRRLMERRPERHRRNLSYCLLAQAKLVLFTADRDSVNRLLARSASLLGPDNDSRGSGRAELFAARFEAASGWDRAAEVDSLGRAFEELARTTPLRTSSLWHPILATRALAEARVGRLAAAWAHALEAESLARVRTIADARALPEGRALELANRVSEPLDALVSVACDSGGPTTSVAWDRVVRWRGLVRDEVARLRSPRDAPRLLESHETWAAAQRRYARLVVSGAGEGGRDSREALEIARMEAEEAERRWRREAGLAASPPAETFGLAEVVAGLAADEALVAFHHVRLGGGRDRLAAFVARAGAPPRLIDLGAAGAVDAAVRAWLPELSSSPAPAPGGRARAEARCRAAGLRVRTKVWDPLGPVLAGARRIEIVGDGPVRDLPWHALPSARGFLVDDDIVVRPLAAERDRLRPPPVRSNGALVAVGDPDFTASPAAPPRAGDLPLAYALRGALPECVFANGVRLEPLASARAEVEAIARRWREREPSLVHLRVGADATEADFKAAAPDAAVLHVATHGVVVADTCVAGAPGTRGVGGVAPLVRPTPRPTKKTRPAADSVAAREAPLPWAGRRVWLAFAGAGRPPREAADENEGWLTAEEVATLDLRGVEWVVLSACQSGLDEAWIRDGVTGMRRAFLLAGARAVIASQWSVEDTSTREWMTALHAAREAGALAASDAARAASRAVLAARRDAKRSTHPFYWAAFAATGD